MVFEQMKIRPRSMFLILLFILSFGVSAAPPSHFSKAKKIATKLYQDNPQSFYCDCRYEAKVKPNKQSKRLTPDWGSCGYSPRKNKNRASRIEWEHVMPAYHFGHQRQCWQQGGRKACKKDREFRKMDADLHNLVPTIGEVNGDRSNYQFGMIEGEKRAYGACDIEIDFKAKRVEPRPDVRGDIARIYFYMRDEYNLTLSRQQTQLMNAWSKTDPVDDWERTKNKRVMAIQGKGNSYIEGSSSDR